LIQSQSIRLNMAGTSRIRRALDTFNPFPSIALKPVTMGNVRQRPDAPFSGARIVLAR
jgi:hypothetical protein